MIKTKRAYCEVLLHNKHFLFVVNSFSEKIVVPLAK